MATRRLNIQRISSYLIVLVILAYILIVGKGFFVPLVMAMLVSFVLRPISASIEESGVHLAIAPILAILTMLIPVFGLIVLFGIQISSLLSEAGNIVKSLESGLQQLAERIGKSIGINPGNQTADIIGDDLSGPMNILFDGFSSSTIMLAGFGLTMVYAYFFLLYRTAIKRFIMGQFEPDKRAEINRVMREIQAVSAKYLYGIGLVMLILGTLNSLGLWLIGIKYAFFWGYLAAILAVVPYIGAIVGGLLPFLYAFATTDSLYYPLAIVSWFSLIQFIEGNFITPKIVGKSVNVNPLFAIMSLLIGAAMWGIIGMIVALPLLAIVRIIFSHIPATQPLALLLSDQLYKRSEDFLEEYDKPKNRIRAIFSFNKKKTSS